MTKDAERLLHDALQLRAEDRARLAEELLASLDEAEADVERAWAEEISRRAADARTSAGEEEDWRAALAGIQREVLKQ